MHIATNISVFMILCYNDNRQVGRRGSVVRTKTLIHEVVGLSPGSGVGGPVAEVWGVNLNCSWFLRESDRN